MNRSDQAFVLHTRPYRESSQVVSLFSRDNGRFSAVSRGARGRAKGTPLQPFCLLQTAWHGKSELKTLTCAEILEARILQGNKLYVGLYLNELLTRLVHENEPHSDLFQHYGFLVDKLATENDIEPLLRIFEFNLLQDLGYGFALDTDATSGEPVAPDLDYMFLPGEGMVLANGRTGSAAIAGKHLSAMAAGDFADAAVRLSAKRLARAALAPHLGRKPLVSRELFRGAVSGSGAPS